MGSDDPILDAIRRSRARHAAKFNYDLEAICADLKKLEGKLPAPVVYLSGKRARRRS